LVDEGRPVSGRLQNITSKRGILRRIDAYVARAKRTSEDQKKVPFVNFYYISLMKDNNKIDNYKGVAPVLIIIALVLYIIYNQAAKTKYLNPRQENGKRYLYSEDSVYLISYKIDTVFSKENESEK
jgi:hypothetical protein